MTRPRLTVIDGGPDGHRAAAGRARYETLERLDAIGRILDQYRTVRDEAEETAGEIARRIRRAYDLDGLAYSEIAARLSLSELSVRGWYHWTPGDPEPVDPTRRPELRLL